MNESFLPMDHFPFERPLTDGSAGLETEIHVSFTANYLDSKAETTSKPRPPYLHHYA